MQKKVFPSQVSRGKRHKSFNLFVQRTVQLFQAWNETWINFYSCSNVHNLKWPTKPHVSMHIQKYSSRLLVIHEKKIWDNASRNTNLIASIIQSAYLMIYDIGFRGFMKKTILPAIWSVFPWNLLGLESSSIANPVFIG